MDLDGQGPLTWLNVVVDWFVLCMVVGWDNAVTDMGYYALLPVSIWFMS